MLKLNTTQSTTYRQRLTLASETQVWLQDAEYRHHVESLLRETYESTGSKDAAKQEVIHDIYSNSRNYGLEPATAELVATVAYNNIFNTHFQSYSECYGNR